MKGSSPVNGHAIPLLPLHSGPASPRDAQAARSTCIQGAKRLGAGPERIAAVNGLFCSLALYWIFPAASTLHLYLAAIVALGTWLFVEAMILAWAWRKRKPTTTHWTAKRRALAGVSAALCLVLFFQGSRLPAEPALPQLPASSLPLLVVTAIHDGAHLLPHMVQQFVQFVEHVGRPNVHLSILESSRSSDATHDLLLRYEVMLRELGIHHTISRLNVSDEHGYWIDVHSRDHVNRHAFARNRALAPLERGLGGKGYSKILFADPVWFQWTDLVRLLGTAEGEFDMACGLEWGSIGLSDAWTFRDQCGIRARPTYPHLQHSEVAFDGDRSFDVTSCWNSMAAVDATPFLQINAQRLKDAMIQERRAKVLTGDGRASTAMPEMPFQFHATSVEECAASEGMLLAYDIHLLHRPNRPRIFVNPLVNVAQRRNWYILYKRILRRPFVRPWVHIWDRYLGPRLLSAARELGRPTEQCQWQGFTLAEGCPHSASGAPGLVA